ncbi:P-loop containing nucleoside triphosphate hydrolase protein [Boeremia exigua]|uniref:P-loop containing nucleoside triphosphate hydrolase protein n=1 Tax=Boeremia exigua TaxID=749465 RepID=UPI001E8DBA50|nr:P-loop containing nucleoside triphosphate hydrolase protein [Boeremia exigua]KAH6612155.1 P-loop containing nucleoside triphosphate hydrolase protein [Boeremia exigua]
MADDAPPSSHRLPTVSASQALQGLHARARAVPTGLMQLDQLLAPPSLPGQPVAGGWARGKVAEVYGPPGVGKTALLLQAAARALGDGQHVYWIDGAGAPLVAPRLDDMLNSPTDTMLDSPTLDSPTATPASTADQRRRFHCLAAPTLAHVLALFVHPPPSFPRPGTSLVVVDSLSTLVDNAYPRTDDRARKTDQSKWAAARRYAVVTDLIAALSRTAAQHDIAVVVTCQTITRIRGPSRALLVPAMAGVEWENGVSARVLLFRDWVPARDAPEAARLQKTRFAGLVKRRGVALADEGGVGCVVPFAIERHGLCDINLTTDDTATTMVLPIQPRPPKRSFDDVDENEEPNSDDVYGWIEDDAVAAEGLINDVPSEGRGPKALRTSSD